MRGKLVSGPVLEAARKGVLSVHMEHCCWWDALLIAYVTYSVLVSSLVCRWIVAIIVWSPISCCGKMGGSVVAVLHMHSECIYVPPCASLMVYS